MNNPKFQFSNTFDHNLNGSRLSQSNSSFSNTCNNQEFVQFRPNPAETDDSGVCSPPLWKNSPSPSRSPSQPLLSHHVYRSLTPAARLQAIAKGQREMMEMVKNMPESCYELSLKDLVEAHTTSLDLKERGVEVKVKVKREDSRKSERNLVRNGSFELERKGMFLKMGFPFSLSKRRNVDRSLSGRVGSKKFSGWSDSDSSRVSNNSGGGGGSSSRSSSGGSSSDRSYGGGRKKNSSRTGCWPFFRSKNVE